MSREGKILTPDAQAEREEFEREYGYGGNCSCHLSPPCGSCTHPGNPINQEEDDDCWIPEQEVGGSMIAAGTTCLAHGCGKADKCARHVVIWSTQPQDDSPVAENACALDGRAFIPICNGENHDQE